MRAESGTYTLLLRCLSRQRIQVGSRRSLQLEPGYYIYVGSAFGPGGVRARVLRHARSTTARHWHIDYLRDVARPVEAWSAYGERKLEHQWAQVLSGLPGMSPVPAFGCSDCDCKTHLFRSSRKPDHERFSEAAGEDVERFAWRISRTDQAEQR